MLPYYWKLTMHVINATFICEGSGELVDQETGEAEYVALNMAAQEAVCLGRLNTDVGESPKSPTVIHKDNQGAITMAKCPVGHASRTKHIDIRSPLTHEAVQTRAIVLNKPFSEKEIKRSLKMLKQVVLIK